VALPTGGQSGGRRFDVLASSLRAIHDKLASCCRLPTADCRMPNAGRPIRMMMLVEYRLLSLMQKILPGRSRPIRDLPARWVRLRLKPE